MNIFYNVFSFYLSYIDLFNYSIKTYNLLAFKIMNYCKIICMKKYLENYFNSLEIYQKL